MSTNIAPEGNLSTEEFDLLRWSVKKHKRDAYWGEGSDIDNTRDEDMEPQNPWSGGSFADAVTRKTIQ